MGGTKLLAGAVDKGLSVHHRVQRTLTGLDQSAVLDVAVEAVEEARAAAGGEIAAVGFGIPCLMDQRSGRGVIAVNLPLANVPFGAIMAERLGLPVFVDNDANMAALAEHRAGAARGTSEAVIMTIGTGIGGGLILRGELYRGGIGAAGELGHVVIDKDGPPLPGQLPQPWVRGVARIGDGTCARGVTGRARAPRLGTRPSADRRARASRAARDRARARRRRGGDRGAAHDRLEPGRGDREPREHLQPRGRGDRWRRDCGRRAAAGAGARRGRSSRASSVARTRSRSSPRQFGVEAGMVGAAALAFDGLRDRE